MKLILISVVDLVETVLVYPGYLELTIGRWLRTVVENHIGAHPVRASEAF